MLDIDPEWDRQMDQRNWPAMRAELERRFAERPRDAWVAAFAGHEACFAPVLGPDEATLHPHNAARGTFGAAGGVAQPMPAPRYGSSRTVRPAMAGERCDRAVLESLGFSAGEAASLLP